MKVYLLIGCKIFVRYLPAPHEWHAIKHTRIREATTTESEQMKCQY